jgi:hypothetical protein
MTFSLKDLFATLRIKAPRAIRLSVVILSVMFLMLY